MHFNSVRGRGRGSRNSSNNNSNSNQNNNNNTATNNTSTNSRSGLNASSWRDDARLGSSGSGSGMSAATNSSISARRFSRDYAGTDRDISPGSSAPRRHASTRSSASTSAGSARFGGPPLNHPRASESNLSGASGRVASNSWGRLKPVTMDPLEELGLPSKGDSRLLDLKTQERYYTKIVERYMAFCSDAGQRDELLRRFAALDLGPASSDDAADTSSIPACPLVPPAVAAETIASPASNKDLSLIVSALRKLREGIVAAQRADNFAVQAYLFCIRLCVLIQHPEGYHPAALHLLRRIHPLASLTRLELAEVAGYLVLDAACRRGALAEAYALRRRYALADAKLDAVLRALATDNYVLFRRVKGAVDGHRARIMDFAERDVRAHALKCLGRAYFAVPRDFVEGVCALGWDRLVADEGVGWTLDGDVVVIRKVKGR